MKKIYSLLILSAFALISCETEAPTPQADPAPYPPSIEILSLDGLNISANVYERSKDDPVIVLCHQARFNKHEYAGIAERLNDLGFTCIAIDQRSGGPIANKQNWTNIRARERGLPVDYLDAQQDITAAVNYANKTYGKKVILWGSSYSSTLVLYEALKNDKVSSVISFSPGNYFSPELGSLIEMLPSLKKPMFVTSSKREVEEVSELFTEMTMAENQIQFVPDSSGFHGSRALWKGQPDGEEYWTAVEAFLEKLK